MSASCLFGEPKFYEDNTPEIIQSARAMLDKDPEFVLKLAVYCRNELYLRSLPTALLAEAANNVKAKQFVRKYAKKIVIRADEITELLSYHNETFGTAVPNSIKKSIADAFGRFDEYQLAKYDRNGKVKLKDAMIVSHAKPKDKEQEALFKRVLERTMKTPETWETVISKDGSTKKNWEAILPAMGYMAVLRNLRNFLQKDVDKTLFIDKLKNKEQVLKSKQFPFRFYSAYEMIKNSEVTGASTVLDALEDVIDHSVANIPTFGGKTVIATDHSGSMCSAVSGKSKICCKDIGDVMAAIMNKVSGDNLIIPFGETIKVVNVSKRSVLQSAKEIGKIDVGHSTNGYKVIDYLTNKNIEVDRVIIFTDMQMWDSTGGWGDDDNTVKESWDNYRKLFPNAKLYLIDLTGYGQAQFPVGYNNVVTIGGWSDKILDFVKVYEEGYTKTIDKIKNIVV